jgi:hypothetical protein
MSEVSYWVKLRKIRWVENVALIVETHKIVVEKAREEKILLGKWMVM